MRLIFTLVLASFAGLLSAQASFSSPESVEYDAANHRWIVGNNGNGSIVSYYPQSNLTVPFASGLSSGPHGIEILGNVLYACDGNAIKGFDLSNGSQVFNLNLGASFLNGLTTDGSNYLFATDFSAKKIYRICPAANTFNIMATTVKTPNGIYYDGANNRCVFVTWGTNAPIQAMSLGDSSITTLLATSLSSCDGITRDNAGYWYVTAWGTNSLNRVDPNFSSAPVSVMTGLGSPADIDINTAGDSIGIPNSGSLNNVVFYTNITTAIGTNITAAEKCAAFPNPAHENLTLTITEKYRGGTITLYDITGAAVLCIPAGGIQNRISLEEIQSGVYFAELRSADGQKREMIRIVKN